MIRNRLLQTTAISGLFLMTAAATAQAKYVYLIVEKDKPPVEVTDAKQIEGMTALLDAAADALSATMKAAMGGNPLAMMTGTPEEGELVQLQSLCEGFRKTPAVRVKQNELLKSYPQLKDKRIVRKQAPDGQGMQMTMTESYTMGAESKVCQDAAALAKRIPTLKAEAKKRSQALLRSVPQEVAFGQRFLSLQLKGECAKAYSMTGPFYRQFQPEAEFLAECKARGTKYTRYDVVEATQDDATGLGIRYQGVGKAKYSGDLLLYIQKNEGASGPDGYTIGGSMNTESGG